MKSCFDIYHVKMPQEYDGHGEKCEKVDFATLILAFISKSSQLMALKNESVSTTVH